MANKLLFRALLCLFLISTFLSCYSGRLSSRERRTIYMSGRTGNFAPLIAERSSVIGATFACAVLAPASLLLFDLDGTYSDSISMDQNWQQLKSNQTRLEIQGREIEDLKSRIVPKTE